MFINTETKKYPVTESEIRALSPNVSFPAVFAPPPPYALVQPTDKPLFDPLVQELLEGEPTSGASGVYAQRWLVRPLPKPVADENMEHEKVRIVGAVVQERNRRQLEGGCLVDGHWFHSDVISRARYAGVSLLDESTYQPAPWRTMLGAVVPLTVALAKRVLAATAQNDIAVHARAESIVADVKRAADPRAVDTGDWPSSVFDL